MIGKISPIVTLLQEYRASFCSNTSSQSQKTWKVRRVGNHSALKSSCPSFPYMQLCFCCMQETALALPEHTLASLWKGKTSMIACCSAPEYHRGSWQEERAWNKLPAACLTGSAYCTTLRPSTAVTHSQFPSREIMQQESCCFSTSPLKKEGFFPETRAFISRQGSPLADHGVAYWLRKSPPVPSWPGVPAWGGRHLAARAAVSSPALDKSVTEHSHIRWHHILTQLLNGCTSCASYILTVLQVEEVSAATLLRLLRQAW